MITANVMTSDPITVLPETTLAEAARIMLERHAGSVPVVDASGALIGVLTESDLLRRPDLDTEGKHVSWLKVFLNPSILSVDYAKMHNRPVSEVMTPNPVFVGPEDTLAEVAEIMQRLNVKRLPVVDEGTLVGMVTMANLLGALTQPPARRSA